MYNVSNAKRNGLKLLLFKLCWLLSEFNFAEVKSAVTNTDLFWSVWVFDRTKNDGIKCGVFQAYNSGHEVSNFRYFKNEFQNF